MVDSTAGTAESLVVEEAGKEPLATGTGECLDVVNWSFCQTFVDVFCAFSDKRRGDQPKSPLPAANVDPIPLEPSQQEAEKPVEGSTVVAQEILGCHSTLAVSGFL